MIIHGDGFGNDDPPRGAPVHWYFVPLYAAPILIVLYSTIRETIRGRREPDRGAKRAEREGRRR